MGEVIELTVEELLERIIENQDETEYQTEVQEQITELNQTVKHLDTNITLLTCIMGFYVLIIPWKSILKKIRQIGGMQ